MSDAAATVKPLWKSKILWVNAIGAALIALESATGAIQPYIPANFYVVMAVALPVVNAMLRVITSQALSFGGEP